MFATDHADCTDVRSGAAASGISLGMIRDIRGCEQVEARAAAANVSLRSSY
jgi:hypothetical protein